MNFLWDTNILVHYIRRSQTWEKLNRENQFFHTDNRVFISIVSVGEIYSLALQRNWQTAKMLQLKDVLEKLTPLPIARQSFIAAYAKIDAFSQGKLAGSPLPEGMSARNMGKNDLWIAATAHEINATLVSTDQDFLHLEGKFIAFIKA